MKRFLKKILIFILPMCLLSYPLDIMISSQLQKSSTFALGEYPVWNDLYNGTIDSKLVIYGSSRAWVHIDPSIIKKETGITTFNLGIDGHNFWLQYLRHKTLLKYNKKPDCIILSLDVFTMQKRKNLFNSDQFLPHMLLNKEIIKYTNSFNGFSKYDYEIPLIRYFGNKKAINESIKNSIYLPNKELGRAKGFEGKEKKWNSDLDNAKKNKPSYKVIFDESTVQLFNVFLKECKDSDINVVLVYSPEYIEGQEYVENRKEIIEYYKTITEENNLTFLDYSSNILCTKKEYFYNASHLNKKGAELFTNLLVEDLKRLQTIN